MKTSKHGFVIPLVAASIALLVAIGLYFYNPLAKKQVDIDQASLTSIYNVIAKYSLQGMVVEALDSDNGKGLATVWEISNHNQTHALFSMKGIAQGGCSFLGCGYDYQDIVLKSNFPTLVAFSPDRSFVLNMFNLSSVEPAPYYNLEYNSKANPYFEKIKSEPAAENEVFMGGNRYTNNLSPSGSYFVNSPFGEANQNTYLYNINRASWSPDASVSKYATEKNLIFNLHSSHIFWSRNEKYVFVAIARNQAMGDPGPQTLYSYELQTSMTKRIAIIDESYDIIDVISPNAFFVSKNGDTYLAEIGEDSSDPTYTKIFPQNVKLVGII